MEAYVRPFTARSTSSESKTGSRLESESTFIAPERVVTKLFSLNQTEARSQRAFFPGSGFLRSGKTREPVHFYDSASMEAQVRLCRGRAQFGEFSGLRDLPLWRHTIEGEIPENTNHRAGESEGRLWKDHLSGRSCRWLLQSRILRVPR